MSLSKVKTQLPACYAEIDTQALRKNYRILKAQAKGAKVMAVVKANAYGHDVEVVANALPHADAFGVARLNEALKLRHARVSNRIVVLGGILTVEDWQLAHANGLDVVLHQASQLDSLAEFLEPFTGASNIAIWLKFDTGMHRLGFALYELQSTVKMLASLQSKLRQPIIVMSHLANADDPADPYTDAQLSAFKSLQAHFSELHEVEYSLANSSALLHRIDTNFNWVRSGLALYGVSGTDIESKFQLTPVMSLCSRLIEVKTVKKGEGIGYGQIWHAPQDTVIGIASLGYGDGYPRELEVQTPIFVGTKECNVVGRVSMDLLAIDLSNCPDARVGDAVEAWGKQVSVREVAASAGTIPYTLLCGISQRVETVVL